MGRQTIFLQQRINEMPNVVLRRDKQVLTTRLTDRFLLFIMAILFFVYAVYNRKIVRKTNPANYQTFIKNVNFFSFVRKITKNRLFLIMPTFNPSIQLYCRAGHEMENLVYGEYEEHVKKTLKPKQEEIVVDVGAHLGEYSLEVAKQVHKVIAIEANNEIFELLKKNIQKNELSNILPINIAVFDSVGSRFLNVFGDKTGMGSIVQDSEDNTKKIQVKTDTLDNILKEIKIQKIDWIKIDVESAEIEVLKGAKKTILSNKDHLKLIIETHNDKNKIKVEEMLKQDFSLNFKSLDSNHIFASNEFK